MRSIFQVGAKLIGILLLVRALGTAPYLLSTGESGDNSPLILSAVVLSLSIHFLLGLGLVFKTHFVANMTGANKLSHELPSHSVEASLKIGIMLIGCYYAVVHIPTTFTYIYEFVHRSSFGQNRLGHRMIF